MSSGNDSLVSPNFFNTTNNGNLLRHNFSNRYLSEEELRKPSREIAQAITEVTRKEINKVVGIKTSAATQVTITHINKFLLSVHH